MRKSPLRTLKKAQDSSLDSPSLSKMVECPRYCFVKSVSPMT